MKNNKQLKPSPSPIRNKKEIPNHPDNKIDMDFPGFPSGHSGENIIKPKTATDRKTAALNVTDGEKKAKRK